MKDMALQLIAFSVTGIIFMFISTKFNWSKKIWKALYRIIPPQYSVAVWIIFGAALTIGVSMVCDRFEIAQVTIIKGLILGFYLAFMPNLGQKKN